MEERIHEAQDLGDAELRSLCLRRDGPGLIRLTWQLLLLVITGTVVVTADSMLLWFPAMIAHGLLHPAFYAMVHEGTHGTAFASDHLNNAAARIGAPFQFLPPALFMAFHLTHHRNTHEADDPELSGTALMAAWPSGASLALTASGLMLFGRRTVLTSLAATGGPEQLWEMGLPYVEPIARRQITREARMMLAFHLFFAVFAWVVPSFLRLYGAMWLGFAVLSMYLAAEHRGLPSSEGRVVDRTRSFAMYPWLDQLMWNMPHHAEHHAYPAVPFHQLPALSQQIRHGLPHKDIDIFELYRTGQAPDSIGRASTSRFQYHRTR